MKLIYKFKSPSFNKRKVKRIKYIIIHYTALKDIDESIHYLCNPLNKVSTHFLISKEGKIYNLVNIKNRAWHAGKSYWDGDVDINSSSIGIELDYFPSEKKRFSNEMINSLNNLLSSLIKKYKIINSNILGHSDIAPYRKIDPGNQFPWKKLILNNQLFVNFQIDKFFNKSLIISWFNKKNLKTKKRKVLFMLAYIGYNTEPSIHSNKNYRILISAYQMRYNQNNPSGIVGDKLFNLIINHYLNKFLNF